VNQLWCEEFRRRIAYYSLFLIEPERFSTNRLLTAVSDWHTQLQTRSTIQTLAVTNLPRKPTEFMQYELRLLNDIRTQCLTLLAVNSSSALTMETLPDLSSNHAKVELHKEKHTTEVVPPSEQEVKDWLAKCRQPSSIEDDATEHHQHAVQNQDSNESLEYNNSTQQQQSQGTLESLQLLQNQVTEQQLSILLQPLTMKLHDKSLCTLDETLDELLDVIERGTNVRSTFAVYCRLLSRH
jgi:hypothetical protein